MDSTEDDNWNNTIDKIIDSGDTKAGNLFLGNIDSSSLESLKYHNIKAVISAMATWS